MHGLNLLSFGVVHRNTEAQLLSVLSLTLISVCASYFLCFPSLVFSFPGSFNLDSNRHKPKENICNSLDRHRNVIRNLGQRKGNPASILGPSSQDLSTSLCFAQWKVASTWCLLKYVWRSAGPFPFLPPHTECICELWPTNAHAEMEADPEQLGNQTPQLSKTRGNLRSWRKRSVIWSKPGDCILTTKGQFLGQELQMLSNDSVTMKSSMDSSKESQVIVL